MMASEGLTLTARFRDSAARDQHQGLTVNVSPEQDVPIASVTAMKQNDGDIVYVSSDQSDQVDGCDGALLGTIAINEEPFQIFVINVAKKPFTFTVLGSYLVEKLMLMIEERLGIPPDQQRLVHTGKQLESGKTLAYYKIKKESNIHLLLRLRGGCIY